MNKKELILSGILAVAITGLVIAAWLPLVNALGLIGVACLAWFYRKDRINRWIKAGLFFLLVPLVFWVATYRPEGFSYPLLFTLPGTEVGESRFELYVNFAKALVGLVLLLLLWHKPRGDEFVAAPRWQFLSALFAPAIIIAVAIPALGLALEPKLIEQIVLFALVNLLVIAVAEEAFMRLLLQQSIRNAAASLGAQRWVQELFSLVVVTGIFVLIHSGLTGAAVWVYALAGLLYGLSYTLSKNVCYPIMIHFWVNLIHFALLTYPIPS